MKPTQKVTRLLEAYPLKAFHHLSLKASNVNLVRQAVPQNVRRVGRAFGIRMAVSGDGFKATNGTMRTGITTHIILRALLGSMSRTEGCHL
jgi:hypothetical protein